MAKYIITNQWSELTEKEGALPNNSVLYPILLAASTTWPDANTPYKAIASSETQNFKAAENEKMYVRLFTNDNEAQFEVSVVTFIPEQLQNCFELPHPSLEYALFIENGELKEWSKDGKSKVQTSEQVGNGDLDTKSLNSKGLNGVIGQDNLRIGKEYKNLTPLNWKDSVSSPVAGVVAVVEGEKVKVTIPSGTLMNNWFPIKISENLLLDGGKTNNIKSSLNINVISGNINEIDDFKTTFKYKDDADTNMLGASAALSLGSKDYTIQADNINIANSLAYNGISINCVSIGWTTTEDIIFYISKVSSVQSDIEVPYIKGSIPDGRCVLDVPWTDKTHSFIGVGFEKGNNKIDSRIVPLAFGEGLHQRIIYGLASPDIDYGKIDFYYNENLSVGTSELLGVVTSAIITGGYYGIINLSFNLSDDARADKFEHFFVYKDTEITKNEFETEIEKIKAKKIKLDPMGFVENIPNSKKRMDESGILKTHIKVTTTEKDEDIYPATEDNLYEIIDPNGVSYVTVGVDGNIPAGNKIKNVAGYVVTDDTVATYPLKLRVVK